MNIIYQVKDVTDDNRYFEVAYFDALCDVEEWINSVVNDALEKYSVWEANEDFEGFEIRKIEVNGMDFESKLVATIKRYGEPDPDYDWRWVTHVTMYNAKLGESFLSRGWPMNI